MSLLSEYLHLIPKALGKPDLVLQGWINDIKLNNGDLPQDQVEEIAKRRIICSSCPFMSLNAKELGTYTGKREDKHCIWCGCPINKLTASLSDNCGIEEWNNDNPEEPMELKWEAYIK